MKRIIKYLADQPLIFNVLRRIIEANYISLRRVIRRELSPVNDITGPASKEKVLDMPCGTGEFCMLFSKDSYHGLDISEKYIDYARKRYERKFFCSDARQSGFSDGYFDKILMIGFLHHLDDPAVDAVVAEAKRILKPDGTLLLIEDAPTGTDWNIIGKVLQKLDMGSNIRIHSQYEAFLEKEFVIKSYYPMNSGFWDYSVFLCLPI